MIEIGEKYLVGRTDEPDLQWRFQVVAKVSGDHPWLAVKLGVDPAPLQCAFFDDRGVSQEDCCDEGWCWEIKQKSKTKMKVLP